MLLVFSFQSRSNEFLFKNQFGAMSADDKVAVATEPEQENVSAASVAEEAANILFNSEWSVYETGEHDSRGMGRKRDKTSTREFVCSFGNMLEFGQWFSAYPKPSEFFQARNESRFVLSVWLWILNDKSLKICVFVSRFGQLRSETWSKCQSDWSISIAGSHRRPVCGSTFQRL